MKVTVTWLDLLRTEGRQRSQVYACEYTHTHTLYIYTYVHGNI